MPTVSAKVVLVAACALVDADGRVLIAQRPPGRSMAGLWEFPGGKRHADETFEACLQPELREELGIEVAVGELLESIEHSYPEKTVLLKFFRCEWLSGQPQCLGCPDFRWITREELENYEFPPADARLLKRLPAIW